jgi:hypothetical protein
MERLLTTIIMDQTELQQTNRETEVLSYKCSKHQSDREYFCLSCKRSICLLCIEEHKTEPDFKIVLFSECQKQTDLLESNIVIERNFLIESILKRIKETLSKCIDTELSAIECNRRSVSKFDHLMRRLNRLEEMKMLVEKNKVLMTDGIEKLCHELNEVRLLDKSDVFYSAKSNSDGKINRDDEILNKSEHYNEFIENRQFSSIDVQCLASCRDCGGKYAVPEDEKWRVRCKSCYVEYRKKQGFQTKRCSKCNKSFEYDPNKAGYADCFACRKS